MARKLKVFRMAVGFEDAYVAASSRKAALALWGSAHDQFARGLAEEVTDPELTREPLARPGHVIRRSRGDLAAQLKAVTPNRKSAKASTAGPVRPAARKRAAPPPTRDKLEAADEALRSARQRYAADEAAIEASLAALRAARDEAVTKLQRRRAEAERKFRAALAAWAADGGDAA